MLWRGTKVSTTLQGFRPLNYSCAISNPRHLFPISLARLEDSDGLSRMFLCCYVDSQTRVYDCEELAAMPVPPQFTRVKELLGIEGDLKRIFGPQGMIFSYDADGKIRM